MIAGKKLTFLLLLAGGLFQASGACAQDGHGESKGPRPGLSVGGRAAYYRDTDSGSGDLMQGVQARYHLTRRWALEGSADFLRAEAGDTRVDVVPLQFSVLIYLMPHGYRVAPYILGGGGWYYTRIRGPEARSEFRFGPHAGGGVEYFFNEAWSADAGCRYLWAEDISSRDLSHPLGRDLSGKAYMATLALNYSF